LGGEDGARDCNAACWCVGDDPADAPAGGIAPGQTQIVDMVGVIRSEGTVGKVISEIDWCGWNRAAD